MREKGMDTSLVFAIVAVIIIIGFAGEFIFRKTGVPIFIFLILMGIILGPVLNLFPRDDLLSTLTPFAQLTLLMVLFYGGLGLKAKSLVECGGRAFIQVVIYVVSSTLIIGSIGFFFLKWDILLSFIFATMISGETTAALIVPLSRSMKLSEPTVTFLTLESAMNSIFSIVLFFAFVGIYTTGQSNWVTAFSGIASQLSVGIVLGAVLGFAWVYILYRFQKQKFTYVLSIALVLISYSLTTELGGNGILAVLVFGILLGNHQLINRFLKKQLNMTTLQTQLEGFQEEISFLLRTLFFVFLGLTFVINASKISANLSVAIIFLLVLLAIRIIATRVSTYKSDLQKERQIIVLMCAQGLTPATLATLAVSFQLPHSDTFLNIVTYIIIFTNIVTTVGSVLNMRKQRKNTRDISSPPNYGAEQIEEYQL
jgi:potassium/hydrogen antiporter